MARKKKFQVPPSLIKYILFIVLIVGVCFGLYKGISVLLTKSEYFKVKTIVIDPSLQFINKDDLVRLKGKNIFLIDLKAFENKLNKKYPQVSHLKLVKRFPDQIVIAAKKRLPIVQVNIDDEFCVLDSNGVALEIINKMDKKITLISGTKFKKFTPVLGLPLSSERVNIALNIANVFKSQKELITYSIEDINVSDLSKIKILLNNGLEVLVDKDKVSKNIRVLSLVLSQRQIDFKEVKYLDLRFKEPIIGKK
ncbi:MAG: FtsQ-type POTRA domain-containing protein [Candidatus Omnitrophica bacterium]|nr:FtsQ-type POTRA domain-containing protein [Candidatus Omnitrophota bacterium]MBU1996610.1 FtsQ-type POTRA domain-containing protein [Candidatus Omnitrophota bacterium]